MKTRNILYLLASCLWLLGSCGKNLLLPASGNQQIVLLGELAAGDSIYIRAGKSTLVQSGALMNDELIENLAINIKDAAGNNITLSGAPDDLSAQEYTIPFSSQQLAEANKQYELTAIHPQMGVATATIAIPKAFNATITDTAGVSYNGANCLRVDIQIDDNVEPGFYVVEVLQQPFSVEDAFLFNGKWIKKWDNIGVYDSLQNAGANVQERMDTFFLPNYSRVIFYTTDPQSEHLLNGNTQTQCRRMLLADKTFNGSTHTTSILLPRANISPFPGNGQRTVIQVKSIAEDYFLYLKAYEQYDPFSGFINTGTPVRLAGNIVNGVGMIGGVFKREFSYYF